MKLFRVILPVDSVEKAAAFYSGLFNDPGVRVSPGRHYFDLGGTILACYDWKADGDGQDTWSYHKNQYLYITVPNLEEIKARLTQLGGKCLSEIEEKPWGETLFYAKDPFNSPICFVKEGTEFTG